MTLKRTLFTAIATIGLVASGCYEVVQAPQDGNQNPEPEPMQMEMQDPGEQPPVEQPPVEQPPVEQPPVEQPPVEEPPPMEEPPPTEEPPVPVEETARALFDRTVAPILQSTCALAGCHSGEGTSPLKFLPPVVADYYDTVTSYDDRVVGYFDKTQAPMINNIVPGPHYTASYTTDEATLIAAWLDKELAERNTGTTPPPMGNTGGPTPGELSRQLISEWSGCMDLATWNQLEVAQEWASLGSGEGPCIRCHINGQGGLIATDESERMFNILTTNRYFMLAYFSPNVTDLANPRMEINYSSFDRVANGLYPHIEHPNFDLQSDAMQALEAFYNDTVQRKQANTCGAPRIVSP